MSPQVCLFVCLSVSLTYLTSTKRQLSVCLSDYVIVKESMKHSPPHDFLHSPRMCQFSQRVPLTSHRHTKYFRCTTNSSRLRHNENKMGEEGSGFRWFHTRKNQGSNPHEPDANTLVAYNTTALQTVLSVNQVLKDWMPSDRHEIARWKLLLRSVTTHYLCNCLKK